MDNNLTLSGLSPMKPSLLTQLGCLGSIAVALSLASAAQAETSPTRTIIFASQSSQSVNLTSGQNNPNQASVYDDQSIAQKAIARFGCDCPACQNKILQSMQQL